MDSLNPQLVEPLTPKEQETLKHVVARKSNHEIAEAMYVGVNTVKTHVTHLCQKFSISNVPQSEKRDLLISLGETYFALPSNSTADLPHFTTPFIGRIRECETIQALIQERTTRVVTLAGVGGIGKTRLSVEVARRLTAQYADGVYFISLAQLSSGTQVIETIAETIGFSFSDQESSLSKQLCSYLKSKSMLLVMDNFEHVLDGIDVVQAVISTTPNVDFLVTSREVLQIIGEQVLDVGGMQAQNHNDALILFDQSAKRVHHDFKLSDDNIDAVTAICRLVEGSPLAIELATTWLRTLSPEDILDELQQGIDLLETRTQSMRAVFDRSWALLSSKLQSAFVKLCVFRGGFTREAAKVVAGCQVHILQQLIDKSFISFSGDRYHIHELMRQYGSEKLVDDFDFEDDIRQAHTEYFAGFMQARLPQLLGNEVVEGLDRIDADYGNVLQGWQYVIVNQQLDILDMYIEPIGFYYDIRSNYILAEPLFTEALDRLHDVYDEITVLRLRIWHGHFLLLLSKPKESVAVLETVYDALNPTNHPHEYARVCSHLSMSRMMSGDVEAAYNLVDEAFQYQDTWGHPYWHGYFLWQLSMTVAYFDRDKFWKLTRECYGYFQEYNSIFGFTRSLNNFAVLKKEQGLHDEAHDLIETLISISKAINALFRLRIAFVNLSETYTYRRDFVTAHQCIQESIHVIEEIGVSYPFMSIEFEEHFGTIAIYEGNFHTALEHFQRAFQIIKGGSKHPNYKSRVYDGLARAFYGLGDVDNSLRSTIESYQYVTQFNVMTSQIARFIMIACTLLVNRVDAETILPAFATALSHPAIPEWYQTDHPIFAPIVTQLKNKIAPATYAQFWKQGQSGDIFEVATNMYELLKKLDDEEI